MGVLRWILLGCVPALVFASGGTELRVFAAASLAEALVEIAPAYEVATGHLLRLNLGGSNQLARQIKEGAPADVFFSADEAKMDELEKAGLIVAGTRRALLSNTLVVIVGIEGGGARLRTPADLATPAVRRLALAEPHTVPAGIYAKAWLESAGLWPQVRDKVVATDNVRGCLAVVEAGNAEAGIVYRTDVSRTAGVRILHEVPAAEGPAISYPVAVVAEGKNGEAARRLVEYLASPPAMEIFARRGFLAAGVAER
ncbi:MAG: molybdate ABC transporter substrate-binding protein [Opitutaceae bacterium]|jgi:molybdate transport system substrate-binding protein|nr:molybdate ABC transporter substrate-binding protein [Opitutaceae bacterium]